MTVSGAVKGRGIAAIGFCPEAPCKDTGCAKFAVREELEERTEDVGPVSAGLAALYPAVIDVGFTAATFEAPYAGPAVIGR